LQIVIQLYENEVCNSTLNIIPTFHLIINGWSPINFILHIRYRLLYLLPPFLYREVFFLYLNIWNKCLLKKFEIVVKYFDFLEFNAKCFLNIFHGIGVHLEIWTKHDLLSMICSDLSIASPNLATPHYFLTFFEGIEKYISFMEMYFFNCNRCNFVKQQNKTTKTWNK